MNDRELLQAALFFDKVRDDIGKEDFDRYKDVIIDLTAGVLDEWRANGKDPEELFDMDEMLMLVDTVCIAQGLMETITTHAGKR